MYTKEKLLERDRVKQKAKIAHPLRLFCRVDGCNELGERHHPDYSKPLEIVWLCREHHLREHGMKQDKRCEIEGCNAKHKALGFCLNHYQQIGYWNDKLIT